jgi:hypothetical protein
MAAFDEDSWLDDELEPKLPLATRWTETGVWEAYRHILVFKPHHDDPEGEVIVPVARSSGWEPASFRPSLPPPYRIDFDWCGSADLVYLLASLGQKTWVTKKDLVALAALWMERFKGEMRYS